MRVLATLLAVVLGVALPAFADDLDDASKLLKAGQRDQALERVNRVLAQKSGDPNDLLAIGVGGRVKLNRRFALTGEYYYVLNPMDGYYNSLSFGVDIETGGHVFQLHFTNSRGMSERTFVGQTDGQWGDGDIHFGFNISRVFTIVRPKDFRNSQNKIW